MKAGHLVDTIKFQVKDISDNSGDNVDEEKMDTLQKKNRRSTECGERGEAEELIMTPRFYCLNIWVNDGII